MERRERSTIEQRLAGFEGIRPAGFVTPPRFDEIIRQEEPPDIDPWWWVFLFHDLSQFWSETIKAQFPSRSALVPFAKHGFTDDVFCFDGTDTSGNPRVYIVHTFTDPGYENRGYWDNFDVFMEAAEEEHAEWLREEAAEESPDE
ncbi:hypothetical protein PU630_00350 [Microbacterium horticulturae]|uniref:SMI1/KNR4 family protein n=1 Tax=Microbacterium horticulturae TaxID=3028316 RepID=A0ABY8C335_9MICO|nr:hypothetical protein [Microbacterium sp. KACC 23027]WEG09048.1 hypothetical protein PU630_00350 [Microbacterium sp. KACC 23027]